MNYICLELICSFRYETEQSASAVSVWSYAFNMCWRFSHAAIKRVVVVMQVSSVAL